MTNFFLLYTGGGMPETEAEQALVMKAWGDWYTSLGSAVADPGNPFTPSVRKVESDGDVCDLPEGPIASGYTILEAASMDQAVEMAKGCPMLQDGGEITVFETYPQLPRERKQSNPAMTEFVLLYGSGGMPESEAEQAAVMQAWMDWYAAMGSAVADAGNPFMPPTTKIASNGDTSDLPMEQMVAYGYIILEADSMDQAVKMAQGCPSLKDGAEVSVYETFPAM